MPVSSTLPDLYSDFPVVSVDSCAGTVIVAQQMGGDFPVTDVGHENDAAGAAFHCFQQMMPTLEAERYVTSGMQQKAIEMHRGKILELLPGTHQGMEAATIRKQRSIKINSRFDPGREKKKIAAGNDAGADHKDPGAQDFRYRGQKRIEQGAHRVRSVCGS